LELSDYFHKLIFNQRTAAPQKVPPWTWSTQGPSLAMPLVLHLVHQLTLREFILSWKTWGWITKQNAGAQCDSPYHQ